MSSDTPGFADRLALRLGHFVTGRPCRWRIRAPRSS